MSRETIADISTYAALLPFLAGLIVYKKAGSNYRLFTFFLLCGFLTDFFVGYFFRQKMLFESQSIFFIYLLAEAMFIPWFISRLCDYLPVSKTAFFLFIIMPFPWAFAHIDFSMHDWRNVPYTDMFEIVIKMFFSILTSWSILILSQKDGRLVDMPQFWFLFGIFFYCFCTFFISAFMQSPGMRNIWFLHNLINIITCFIYTFGFFRIETKKVS